MSLRHRGRQSIFTSETEFNERNLVDILNSALKIHLDNVADMQYLIDYYLGNQPVLTKSKSVRPEINNKIVVNLAQAAVRDIKGYTFGSPIVYASRTLQYQDELAIINDGNEFENKSMIDNDVQELMLITGIGYRALFPEKVEDPDEEPFRYAFVDPRSAFIIRSTEIGNRPMLAVLINKEIVPIDGSASGYKELTVYTVYSRDAKWVYKVNGAVAPNVTLDSYITPVRGNYQKLQVLGTLPIEEFTFNTWKLGFFETVLDIMDSLNLTTSDTLDDIEQKIRSKLLLFGIDPRQLQEVEEEKDSEGNVISTKSFVDKVKDAEVLAFSNDTGTNQDAKFVNNILDYNGVNNFRDFLESMYYYILGLPERNARSSGGDTGQAVALRDGWASLETVARNIEKPWVGSERESLKRLIAILKTDGKISNIRVRDIDITLGRNKYNNILVKAQTGQIMAGMSMFDPVDIVKTMDITTDPEEMVARGKKYQEEKQKELEEQMQKQMVNQQNEQKKTNAGTDVQQDLSNATEK